MAVQYNGLKNFIDTPIGTFSEQIAGREIRHGTRILDRESCDYGFSGWRFQPQSSHLW
jgi:hypothetical protein